MKFRTGPFQTKLNVWANQAQRRCRVTQRRRIEIRFSEADYFCQPVKIRAAATPTSKAARPRRIFAAGFNLDKPQTIVRTLERPLPLPRPAGKVREPIDWRICGDQDPQPEE